MGRLFRTARALKCVMDGRVISLAELRSERPQCYRGSGFAVLPPVLMGTPLERLLPETVRILSPADGVVISTDDAVTLRTGDGIRLSVSAGSGLQLHCEVGEKVRGGRLIGTVARKELMKNDLNGAVAVMFHDTDGITELHVISGRRRAGWRTAFYRIRPSVLR